MNRIFLLLLLNLFGHQLSAQSSYGIGFVASPSFYQIKEYHSTYTSETGHAFGLKGHYYVNNSKISVGLIFNKLVYERSFIPITNTTILDPAIALHTTFDNRYLKIPTYYSYTLFYSNSFLVSASFGFATNFLLRSNEQTLYQDLVEKESSFSNKMTFSGLIGLNVNYELKENLFLVFNAIYEKNIKPYDPFQGFSSEFRPYLGIEYVLGN